MAELLRGQAKRFSKKDKIEIKNKSQLPTSTTRRPKRREFATNAKKSGIKTTKRAAKQRMKSANSVWKLSERPSGSCLLEREEGKAREDGQKSQKSWPSERENSGKLNIRRRKREYRQLNVV